MQQKIIAHIMAAKAGKTDGLKNTIRIKSVSLGLDSNDAAIEKCIIYCEKNGILRREGDKVLYPPFTDAITHSVKNELEEKAKLFFSKFRQNKPTKRASLVTVCQNLLKLDNAQTEAMIHYLVAQKKNSASAKPARSPGSHNKSGWNAQMRIAIHRKPHTAKRRALSETFR